MDDMEWKDISWKLLDPDVYPHKPQKIHFVQTQMSLVFLTGEFVYKVKKPVNLGYLDYTTLEKRLLLCRQEVELNRRLCPDIYLGVVPIVREGGKLYVEGQGKVIEYAVKMKQLPADRMMDVLLLRKQVTEEMVVRVAEKLADFHRKAETNERIAGFGELEIVRQNTEENFIQTKKYIAVSIPESRYLRIKDYTDRFIAANAELFRERVKEGKIRDCHGDLHAAHICFPDGVCIYDCIEFNERFRYCDVASEVAFLAMDLDHYGEQVLSQCFVETYVSLSGDKKVLALLDFYKCYRAYVRGKVESFKLDDPLISAEEKAKALQDAQGYFELAESYIH
jgi:aminoglycoside phosphotransferase family enzyme